MSGDVTEENRRIEARPRTHVPWWTVYINFAGIGVMFLSLVGSAVALIGIAQSIGTVRAEFITAAVGLCVTMGIFIGVLFALDRLNDVKRWRRRYLAQGRCPNCLYNIRNLPGARCPECGETWEEEA